MLKYFNIAPKAPLFKPLTYQSPQPLQPGQRVKIPLGKTETMGLVLEQAPPPKGALKSKVKEVLARDENSPPLPEGRIRWLKWMSAYYHYPLGLIADLCFLNQSFKKPKAKIKASGASQKSQMGFKLTAEQELCAKNILRGKGFQTHLIHGVTGSGKTEIYRQLIEAVLGQGRQALFLLPEIFLTPQIVRRMERSLPGQSALIHSQIPIKEKKQDWQDLLAGRKNLLVGTRSALFCPLPHIGLIIIDEEHDSGFKQDDNLCYHARDSALVLGKALDVPVVMGSATPDFSSYQKALSGSYQLYELKKRALKQNLPQVTVVDLKQNQPPPGQAFWLSDILLEKIKSALKKGKQIALFLNRRGQAGAMICAQCGQAEKCPNCDISLTPHKNSLMICHYCSFMIAKPKLCPFCKSPDLLEKGLGTQKIQETMERLFPKFKTLRADTDSLGSREEKENFIDIVEKNQAHIIVGTQMLSKGLNFPSIYLVGLIMADMGFNMPDFRAGEKSFQTLLQMAGRAGRSGPGEVVLQSFHPEHYSIRLARKHDYKGFFYEEIKSRKTWAYPPFCRLCLIRIDSQKKEKAQTMAQNLVEKAKALGLTDINILGPAVAPVTKIKNWQRFQILIKGANHRAMDLFLKKMSPFLNKKTKAVRIKIDRDPLNML